MEVTIPEIIGPFDTEEGDYCRVVIHVVEVFENLNAANRIELKVLVPGPETAAIGLIRDAGKAEAISLLRRAANELEKS